MSNPLPELRASDSDRERTVEVLRHAALDGQLTVAELEERVSAAYAARARRELEQLTADVSSAAAQAQHASALAVREGPGGERWLVSIMGSADINVPNGIDVRVSNFAFMGGNDVELGDERAPAGGRASTSA